MDDRSVPIDESIQQIAYTADELDALRPLMARVPTVVLTTAMAVRAEWSVIDAFTAMAERDRVLVDTAGSLDPGMWRVAAEAKRVGNDGGDPLVQLELAGRVRAELVKVLEGIASDPAKRSDMMAQRLVELVHDDAEVLRDVAFALHAGPVTGRGEE